jgi:hypothetical protein
MEKHKTNNSIGWLLLAPGTTMFAVGGIINATHSDNIFTAGLNSKGAKVGLAGSLMALTSIPFFISAGNNRKMAFLSLKKEKLSLLEKGPGKFSYPAIAVKIIL